MWGQATSSDEPHYAALERLAARALTEKAYELAFRLADRRCRIAPAPMPHSYLLRAEASFRLGQKQYAIADLGEALAISPTDLHANRRMLTWSKGSKQRAAALALISSDRDINVLRQAIDVLNKDDRVTHASLNILDQTIEGWVVWDRDTPAEISIVSQDSTTSYSLDPDPSHPLGNQRLRAANFALPRPRSDAPQSFSIAVDDRRFLSLRAPGNQQARNTPTKLASFAIGSAAVTVIVPIYGDFAATKACLDSLVEAMKHSRDSRAVLVNDATPDRKIEQYLSRIAGGRGITLLTNSQNLGFVASVNRALRHAIDGDVILLNSDTVVPASFIDRLASTAHATPDVGTVTPLSNNGEFCSFPVPQRSHPMGSLEDIIFLDELAASVNRGIAIDIPSGIGFCLYITRACLDAVGLLSESFHRGYLEDVDFCLRARAQGYRSVCDPSVYVGHAGSRSFKAEKRSLVLRNLDVLDIKFPSYRNECSAFESIDPIRSARERIERRIPLPGDRPRLIVTGDGAIAAAARHRTHQLQSRNQSVLTLKISRRPDGIIARLLGPNGSSPQNIEFGINEPSELKALDVFLRASKLSCIEIWDPAGIPDVLLELMVDGRAPYELHVSDPGVLFPRSWRYVDMVSNLGERRSGQNSPRPTSGRQLAAWRRRWREIATRARAVIVPCSMAEAFAARHFGNLPLTRSDATKPADRLKRRAPGRPPTLGILPLRTAADEFTTTRTLIQCLHSIRLDLSIIVVGATMDDIMLMKTDNCFVTGPAGPEDLDRIVAQYALNHLLVGVGRPLFGHPLEEKAIESGFPIARFDWSFGHYQTRHGDTAIDAALDISEAAKHLVYWMESR